MKNKSSNNKFIRLLKMPIRALAKARDMYVRTMNKYADMGRYDGLAFGGPVYADPMPRSLSTSTLRTANEIDRALKEQLVRAASTGSIQSRTLVASIISGGIVTDNKDGATTLKAGQTVQPSYPRDGTRCSSVAMAKIEEDEPSNNCDDDVVDKNVKMSTKLKNGDLLRSKSKAVGETRKTNVVL